MPPEADPAIVAALIAAGWPEKSARTRGELLAEDLERIVSQQARERHLTERRISRLKRLRKWAERDLKLAQKRLQGIDAELAELTEETP